MSDARAILAIMLVLASCSGDSPRDATNGDVGRDGGREASRQEAGFMDSSALDVPSGCSSGTPGVTCLSAAGVAYGYGPLAVDDQNLYWGESGDEASWTLLQMSRAGGTPLTLASGLAFLSIV